MTRFLKALFGATLAVVHATAALATGIVPFSGTQQFDVNASPPAYLVGGQLYVYQAGSTTCAHVYQDVALTTLWPCPIVLGAGGRIPAIYGADGTVRLRLLSASNLLQFDDDNVALVTAPASSGTSTPIPDATQIYGTGDIKVRFDNQPIPGYVRLNGRTIGSASSGASERANADTQNLFIFLWPFANVSVVGGKGATAASDWAANKQLTLPDGAGRLLGAVDDLGNGPQGRISTTVTGPTVIGAAGGAETHALTQAMLPNVNFTGTATPQSSPVSTNQSVYWGGTVTNVVIGAGGNASLNGIQGTITTTLPNYNATVSSGGSGTGYNSMPPVMLFTVYMKL